MLDLKLLLLLNLLSFSLQDKHCLVTFEGCYEKGEATEPEYESQSEIAHCVYEYEEGKCDYCEDDYLVSHDEQKCIPFKNCYQLDEGDKKCLYCKEGFLPNSDGQCERSTCSKKNGDVCTSCYEGYYLKENQCQKITLPYCVEVLNSNENKCERCLKGISKSNGECVAPEKIIKGCVDYDTKGKCTECDEDFYTFNNGNCNFNGCPTGQTKIEGCGMCEVGFYFDEDELLCVGYDGTKDTSKGMGIKYALLALVIFSLI